MQQPTKTASTRFAVNGMIVGVILGYPLSYYFQSGAVRAKISLGQYIQQCFEIIGNKDLLPAVFLGFVVAIGVCAAAGFFIGQAQDQKK
jgi:hypothetical protein